MPRSRLPAILAATIATLPDKPPFPPEQREAFFAMLHCAIDVAYGRVESAPLPTNAQYRTEASLPPGVTELLASAPIVTWQQPSHYTIDQDGFAMCDDKPVKFTEPLPGVIFQDQRTVDVGNSATILWHDCGTRLDGAMPPGTTLKF